MNERETEAESVMQDIVEAFAPPTPRMRVVEDRNAPPNTLLLLEIIGALTTVIDEVLAETSE